MCLGLDPALLPRLLEDPVEPSADRLRGVGFQASVLIPDYRRSLLSHYGRNSDSGLPPLPFHHFGLLLDFESPVELALHDHARTLDAELRSLVRAFGPVLLRNVVLQGEDRRAEQRNVFSSLQFHIDRGPTQPDHYTLFWRDPQDAQQRSPRSSSTLVMANTAAFLQAEREGQGGDFRSSYQLLENEPVDSLKNKTLIEIPWRAPEGTGEVAVLDNTTVLHASYYVHPELRGYPISVRYLA
ncbi:hypothetical protein [Pelagibius sp.]|uniref:hypothetical protein n=1 Tax=Pelagibius sp. TaxID=1931238 RepID=UPI003B50D48C